MNVQVDMDEIRAGNQSEFRRLVDDQIDSLYALVVRITCNEEDARDIVQDTFMKLWEKRKTIRSDKSIIAYIRRIAVNKCYDLLRMRKHRPDMKTDNPDVLLYEITGGERADHMLDRNEALSMLKTLAMELSPLQRIVFTMIEIEELSHDEVSEITGIGKTSVKSNLRHARVKVETKIRKYLNEEL